MGSRTRQGYGKPFGSEKVGEAVMIQNLTDESFAKVCIDSGAVPVIDLPPWRRVTSRSQAL